MTAISRRNLLATLASGACAACVPLAALDGQTVAPSLIALNANENPYGPSPAALAAARQAASRGAYYDFSSRSAFRQAVADGEDLTLENVVLSTGSNEALCAAVAAWGKQGHILAPQLTYSAHLNYARRVGVDVQTIPLNPSMAIDLEAMAAAVNQDTALVYLCNPNNPTGLPLNTQQLQTFCETVGKNTTILLDEAYIELSADPRGSSMVKLIQSDTNIIVTRTFSKVYGLAGMRVGYAMARSDLAKKLSDHVMSWTSHISVAAAMASYGDQAFIALSQQQIAAGRKIVADTYARHGINTLPSSTNFVFADLGRDAAAFASAMKDRGILINGNYSGFPTWSRVSMGRLEHLQMFSKVFDEVFS